MITLSTVSILALAQGALSDDEVLPPEDVFASFQEACEQDGGSFWGTSLCGGVILFDRDNRVLYANKADLDGEFSRHENGYWIYEFEDGEPTPAYTDTATEMLGERWALMRYSFDNGVDYLHRIAIHESFHRIQPGLNTSLDGNNDGNAHLDEEWGRIWIRLQLRALGDALTADTRQDRLRHLSSAVSMAQARFAAFDNAEFTETHLERDEGIAEYTGWALHHSGDAPERFAAQIAEEDNKLSYSRSFAYVTGPAWGLVLDQLGADWRSAIVGTDTSFAQLAIDRVPDLDVNPSAEDAATEYGFENVRAEEAAQAEAIRQRRADYTQRFITGPHIILPMGRMNFNPQTVTTMGEAGQVYGTFTINSSWGSMSTERGALVNFQTREVRIDWIGEPQSPVWQTDRWELELNEGWEWQADGQVLRPVQVE